MTAIDLDDYAMSEDALIHWLSLQRNDEPPEEETMTSPRTWSTAGWHDRRESRTRGPDDEIDAGIADYEGETMHDSGEHDTPDDQAAYEAEHGTREYWMARQLRDALYHAVNTPDTPVSRFVRLDSLRKWHEVATNLTNSLAPRPTITPTITPTGRIEDVKWSNDEDQDSRWQGGEDLNWEETGQ